MTFLKHKHSNGLDRQLSTQSEHKQPWVKFTKYFFTITFCQTNELNLKNELFNFHLTIFLLHFYCFFAEKSELIPINQCFYTTCSALYTYFFQYMEKINTLYIRYLWQIPPPPPSQQGSQLMWIQKLSIMNIMSIHNPTREEL